MRIRQLKIKDLQYTCLISLVINISCYIVIKLSGQLQVGGIESGNDSDYYHAYAVGINDNAVNIWPVFLRFLNDANLYSRELISYAIYGLYIAIAIGLPRLGLLDLDVDMLSRPRVRSLRYIFTLLILLYPTPFLFSLDLYRDVVMAALLFILIFHVNIILSIKKHPVKLLSICIFSALCFLIYNFRPYLGFAAFVSIFAGFLCSSIHLRSKRNQIYLFILFVVIAAIAFKSIGLIDSILLYRGEEGFQLGGSSFGIGLYNSSPILFPSLVLMSFIFQFFGFYITSPQSLVMFVVESIPFMIALRYAFNNIEFMDRFSLYLFCFIVIYSFLVSMGNDNLGTALRLRMPTYLCTGLLALRISIIKTVTLMSEDSCKSIIGRLSL